MPSVLPQAPSAPPRLPSRILCVEADASRRLAMFSALARPGVVVECVRDGREALEHFEKYGASDLLVTAHLLPQLDGPRLVRRLREAGFDGPVIVAAPTEAESAAYRDLRIAAIVPTPISAATLVAAAEGCAG